MAYKYSYDKEADVLSITLQKKPYDHAVEMGDFIIHVDREDKPVYLEVLNARHFIQKATATFPSSIRQSILFSA